MTARGEQLAVSEAEYRELSGQRRELLKRIEDGRNRLTEITNCSAGLRCSTHTIALMWTP
jgi:hypothetical protein